MSLNLKLRSFFPSSSSFPLEQFWGFFCFLFFCSLWDPSSPTRDQTRAPFSGSAESQPLDHHGIPTLSMLILLQIRDTNPKIFHHYLLVFTNIQWDALGRNYGPYFTDEKTKAQKGCNGPMKIPVARFPDTHQPSWGLYALPLPHPSAWRWLGVGFDYFAFWKLTLNIL